MYLNVCITNTGVPTSVKRAYVSVKDREREVLRLSPWKVLEYIDYRQLHKSPELNKALSGARIDANDAWGPHNVLFTAQKIVDGKDARLPDGKRFLIVEVVGQKPICKMLQ